MPRCPSTMVPSPEDPECRCVEAAGHEGPHHGALVKKGADDEMVQVPYRWESPYGSEPGGGNIIEGRQVRPGGVDKIPTDQWRRMQDERATRFGGY